MGKTSRNLPVVILSSDRLKGSYSSAAQSISKELAKKQRVYFLNRPYSYKDVIIALFKGGLSDANAWKLLLGVLNKNKFNEYDTLISVHIPATLPINWIKNRKVYNFFQRYNDWITYRSIQKIVKQDQVEEYLFVTSYNPYYLPFVNLKWSGIRPMLNIYQCRDDISHDEYTKKHGPYLEKRAVEAADLVIVTSKMLRAKHLRDNANTYEINNGVNYEMFAKAVYTEYSRPAELRHTSGKILGYTGNLDRNRVDYKLLKKVANHFGDCTILLVGPITSNHFYDEGLDKVENILSIGSKDISELPQYLAFMDVAFIPFLKNGFNKSVYPLKLNEYLASGRSVVSTDFSEDIVAFADSIEIGASHDEFIEKIQILLSNIPSREETDSKLEIAKSNSWTNRVDQLHKLIDLHLPK